MHEDSMSRLISVKASYNSVQNLLFSRLLPKNVNIKIYKIIILPWFLMCVKLGQS